MDKDLLTSYEAFTLTKLRRRPDRMCSTTTHIITWEGMCPMDENKSGYGGTPPSPLNCATCRPFDFRHPTTQHTRPVMPTEIGAMRRKVLTRLAHICSPSLRDMDMRGDMDLSAAQGYAAAENYML